MRTKPCDAYLEYREKRLKQTHLNWSLENTVERTVKCRIARAKKEGYIHPLHDNEIEMVLEDQRRRLELCIGLPHHLDHIFPIRMGGLHHHENLQVIPRSVNLSKNRKLNFKHSVFKTIKDLPEWLYDECCNHYNEKLQLGFNS